ncbi:hypothetical protein EPUL_000902 [Erysiphe pulchra]|uniref:Uncharacterized protein n=1 Tax=Erysiphe pulchra TaxID=225359 RepID=A0A2S4PW72_9PEZI|nr:hypothetical protein EPUL_000902 [Erysiphe pulchra]
MAPPQASKRALSPDLLNAGNRVSKPKSTTDPLTGELPTLPIAPKIAVASTPKLARDQVLKDNHNVAGLMDAIKGLQDLTNDILKNLELQHPKVGPDFLALLADGASRAMCGERVYFNTSKISETNKQGIHETWAEKAKNKNLGIKVYNLKRQVVKL